MNRDKAALRATQVKAAALRSLVLGQRIVQDDIGSIEASNEAIEIYQDLIEVAELMVSGDDDD